MSKSIRIFGLVGGIIFGYVGYRLFNFAWKVFTSYFSQIKPLHLLLAILAVPCGLVAACIMIVSLWIALSR